MICSTVVAFRTLQERFDFKNEENMCINCRISINNQKILVMLKKVQLYFYQNNGLTFVKLKSSTPSNA